MRSLDTIRDQVAFASNPARLRIPAFKVIDGLQKTQVSAGEQILGVAVALIAICETAGVSFNDVVAKAIRMTSGVEGPFTSHLQAVRDYAANELRGGAL